MTTLSPSRSLAVGLLCLALAAWLAPGGASSGDEMSSMGDEVSSTDDPQHGAVHPSDGRSAADVGAARPVMEPVARALVPLGPVRAVASSVLWMLLQRKQQEGDEEAVADLAEGLLALHPGLEEVRVFLARQLVVTEAPRSADDARHKALVARGLRMLEDGFALDDTERLHGVLGSLLAIQMDIDPRFTPVAAKYFGERPEDVAISELRLARAGGGHALNLILLLVDRGMTTLRLDGDPFEAARDLEEATAVLEQFDEAERMVIAPELEELRQRLDAAATDDEDRRS